MIEQAFILKQRFEVRPTSSSLVDTVLQREMKLEPRLMKLLCILAKQPGELVKREQLVTEIWDDYGGGEAGLNHAISMLRKLLNDTSKELIETIPTKGYILHAEIDDLRPITDAKIAADKRISKRSILYFSVVLLTAISISFLTQFQTGGEKEVLSAPKGDLQVPFDRVNQKTEETFLNTIVTIGEDSTEYKLKVVGESRPEFYVNGRLLSPDEMEKHIDLIRNLSKHLNERSR